MSGPSDHAARPLAGRRALITGVGRRAGIGLAIARRLHAAGADLFLQSWSAHDREQAWGTDDDEVPSLLGELRGAGGGPLVEHAELDLAPPDAPSRLLDEARRALGHVDILVANHARSSSGSLFEVRADELDRCWAVNARASILLVQAFAEGHDGRAGGRIVLMTSGLHLGPMTSELAYAASKSVLQQVTPSLSAELAPRGITVNCVNPGPTDTGWADEATHRAVLAATAFGRWGQPDDAARLVHWLCTDDACWITGQVINSEGGFRR